MEADERRVNQDRFLREDGVEILLQADSQRVIDGYHGGTTGVPDNLKACIDAVGQRHVLDIECDDLAGVQAARACRTIDHVSARGLPRHPPAP